ncbi:hypothetical protein EJ04DRAFT_499188 [Polyplosphaeria fusca]|uniref:Transcriptional regulatory protein RXT2 N-terminal domain-containing protein n=1 Tax=Polyplosphaeria fusca TaxID=682080 RepID=A0A9P4QT82_9PLEO|nr:hypothetical protein EJ04DRAFT_499188 [Polyplosphaeria fusca]
MAGQQQQIMDTIFSMKRRLMRKDDSSDSDETDTPYNKRLQSLKRKAQYTRSGKPELQDAPPFKKRIQHAGHRRYILKRNPPRFDPDGDIVEIGDEYEDEDDLSTVEENPIAYTSKHLTNLTNEAGAMSRKEQINLWRSKSLFTKLQGDVSWVPAGLADMNATDHLQPLATTAANGRVTNGEHQRPDHAETAEESQTQDTSNTAQDVAMADAEQQNGSSQRPNGDATTNGDGETNGNTEHTTNGISHMDGVHQNGEASTPADDGSDTASQHTAHRMTTRARAQAPSSPSPPSSPSSVVNPIHPLFSFPTELLPDRDFGLPAAEAEDTRLLLLAFVQKQEEVSRASLDLHHGLLKGERMRQAVFKWAKAEGHVGEMSDGEDWYDKEEWGLDSELIKGRDEEEDDTAVQGKKSTRQRRAKDKD